MFHTKRRIYEFIVDETLIKVGGEFVWLWIASEPKDKTIIEIHISYEKGVCLFLSQDFHKLEIAPEQVLDY